MMAWQTSVAVLLGCLEVAGKSSNEQRTTVDLIAAGPPPESAADAKCRQRHDPPFVARDCPLVWPCPYVLSFALNIDSLQVQSAIPAIGARHRPNQ
jgi:hypothetical protein